MTGHPDSLPHSPGVDPRSAGEGGIPSDPGDTIHSNESYMHHQYQTSINHESINCIESDYGLTVPMAPVATPVQDSTDIPLSLQSDDDNNSSLHSKVKLEPLHSLDRQITLDMDIHMNRMQGRSLCSDQAPMMSDTIKSQPTDLHNINDISPHEDMNNCCSDSLPDDMGQGIAGYNSLHMLSNAPKTWSQQDMENALDALRNHNMSLTKASATYGIPSTTLWQRAHRLGIDTPKKEGPSKSWSEGNLHSALQALRSGTISANKASKAYGIPSSTLYKIARREGIRLAAPFNAAPTTWKPGDLEKALHSIRSGQSSVQKASAEFGIPTGTLYGRCKREGIELSRTNPTPWSEDAMGEALESVRVGQMSINQAAIHYNLPYSSLYGRFKRCKFEGEGSGEISPQQLQDTHQHNSNSMLHQQSMSHQSMLSHEQGNQECPPSMYSPYHHPSMHSNVHNTSDTCLPHSNQDCITTS